MMAEGSGESGNAAYRWTVSTNMRSGEFPLSLMLKTKRKPGDHHFIFHATSTSYATDQTCIPVKCFILEVIQTLVMDKVTDTFVLLALKIPSASTTLSLVSYV